MPFPSSALRLSLSKRADRIACSYGAEHVTITVIHRRSWLARAFLGNPYEALRK